MSQSAEKICNQAQSAGTRILPARQCCDEVKPGAARNPPAPQTWAASKPGIAKHGAPHSVQHKIMGRPIPTPDEMPDQIRCTLWPRNTLQHTATYCNAHNELQRKAES